MCIEPERRQFLLRSARTLGGVAAAATSCAWAAAGPAPATRRLVVVMLRGAVDGLSVVVPYADPEYRRARPGIALAPPGEPDGAIDLDGQFGLHPSLAVLAPWWQQGRLAFVHASGSPDRTRSHFDAQDYMESGIPGNKSIGSGWMNRLLAQLPGDSAPLRAIAVGSVQPRIVSGAERIAYLDAGRAALRPAALDQPRVQHAFAALYDGDDAIGRTFREAGESRRDMLATMEPTMMAADNGAPPVAGFAEDAARLGTLMRRDARVQLGFLSAGGWDTHVNQGGARGPLAVRLGQLGAGIDALWRALGERQADTVVVVMSEFGRTVRQNGNGGTDHGHGNAMWLLGGTVAGRRVLGRWPGLDSAALHEGRDLAVTTDFRTVLGELAGAHLGLPDAAIEAVFPGRPAAPPVGAISG